MISRERVRLLSGGYRQRQIFSVIINNEETSAFTAI